MFVSEDVAHVVDTIAADFPHLTKAEIYKHGVMMPAGTVIGVDLGQRRDFTSLCYLQRLVHYSPPMREQVKTWRDGMWTPEPVSSVYQVHAIERMKDTDYPTVVDVIKSRMESLRRDPGRRSIEGAVSRLGGRNDIYLAMDQTGLGQPVTEYMQEKGLDPFGIIITGGKEASIKTRREATVPRVSLLDQILVLKDQKRLSINRNFERTIDGEALRNEMIGLRRQYRNTATVERVTYETPSGGHDDMLMSLGIALWFMEHGPAPVTAPRNMWLAGMTY